MTDPAHLSALRQRLMTPRKIICTGNPDRPGTVAQAIHKLWPQTTFVSQSLGYDFLQKDLTALQQLISSHNTFINSSYVAPGVQLGLLELARQTWKFGHVINLGSTHEFQDQGEYGQSKRVLRERSLELHDYRFRTTHVILGGLRDSDPQHQTWLNIDDLAHTIKWIIEQSFDVPLIGVQAEKQPW